MNKQTFWALIEPDCKKFKCKCGDYRCQTLNYCIPIERICDGISDCVDGDDEEACCT